MAEHTISEKLPIAENISECITVETFQHISEMFLYRTHSIIIVLDEKGKICFANNSAAKTLGYTVNELFEKHLWDIDPSRSPKIWDVRRQDWKYNPYENFETTYRRSDGTTFPVEVYGLYVEYEGRGYVFLAGRDITRRVSAENEIKLAKAEVELYLDFLTHDIGNMNQISIGYLEMAMDMLNNGKDIKPIDKQIVEAPYNALKNVDKMVENIKKVQRERRGYYKKEKINMAKVIKEVVDMFREIPGRNVKINTGHLGDCDVVADELLKDVFFNIIGNAIKHSTGSLEININMTSVVYGSTGQSYCTASVSDNGPGISDKRKQTLFEVTNYRENGKAHAKGFGIYLIKTIVDKYNGAFWVEDRVPGDSSKGAKFSVSLPIAN
jgi:PAS domain S-box-containing protein